MKKIVAKDKDHLEQIIIETVAREGNNTNLKFIDTSQITNMEKLFLAQDLTEIYPNGM